MNKIVYFGVNIIAVVVCIFLLIMGHIILKIVGGIGLIYIIKEFVTGKYKRYIS